MDGYTYYGVALMRRPVPELAQGIVTHMERTPVDPVLAARQYTIYQETVASAGWRVHEVETAPGLPDSVFVEDPVVVCEDLAILARPGADARRGEVDGVEASVRLLGLRVARIEAPGTLDGGDVLQVGSTVYVGVGGRTDTDGAAQLEQLVKPLGREVVRVELGRALHLKSAVTALPDGSLIGLPELVDADALPPVRRPPEEKGAHVLPLGGRDVLVSAAAHETVHELAAEGWRVLPVDISEFEKLEACVTCLSVLVPDRAR
ncbi:dimethylargininase [Nocardiopsis tropica]|uniref:N(G),N(G)-dimethylarginine dimethylaminohydrolase n=1 Tax=Nocardiopsis tropica TaxID=109330 RepID=A0ABU7KRQ3_9ACTN|nr:dimethylargininase [Nocardiopsis umidischolae]MEE2051981.1 N(G),N(G)-dimethylarginine dimethylaminohydrolase [Nocardiopsis umidischolae]